MMDNQTLLFKATQAVLTNASFNMTIDDPKGFFILSHENGLSGMIYSVLNPQMFPKDIYKAFEKDFFAYTAKDMKQLELIKLLKETLNTHSINHIFLKGSHLKKVYPESYMRSMGDIDCLIEEDHIQTVKPILERAGFKRTLQSSAHDVYTYKESLEVEIHPKITKEIDEKYDDFFKNAWDYAYPVNQATYQLEKEFELIYLLIHLIKHFHSSGVGLRSILDIGLFVRAYEKDLDLKTLEGYLTKTQTKRFFINLMKLNKVYFNLNPLPIYTHDEPLDDLFYKTITTYILRSGIHGHGSSFNNFVGRMSVNKRNDKKTFSYIIRMVFPRLSDMQGMYPILYKVKLLLPLFWGVRAFKLLFLRTKRSFTRLKQIKASKKNLDQTIELYNQLGI
jgi:hypothetical protein